MKLPIVAILYPTKEELDRARAQRRNLGFQQNIGGEIDDIMSDLADQVLTDADIEELAGPVPRYGDLKTAYDTDGNFRWVTHKGQVYRPDEMATPHLFYTLRMLFNHSVPPVFRVVGAGEEMKRYRDVPQWDAAYRAAALDEIAEELDGRDDLESPLKEQYADIKANAAVIVALGI